MSMHIIVIGASAGGVEALRILTAGLPKNFPAPVFIVMHSAPDSPSMLSWILDKASTLHAVMAKDRLQIEPGKIYIAPPDRHLVIEPGIMRLTRGPKENRFRPAIDPLFRSAAQTY